MCGVCLGVLSDVWSVFRGVVRCVECVRDIVRCVECV